MTDMFTIILIHITKLGILAGIINLDSGIIVALKNNQELL